MKDSQIFQYFPELSKLPWEARFDLLIPHQLMSMIAQSPRFHSFLEQVAGGLPRMRHAPFTAQAPARPEGTFLLSYHTSVGTRANQPTVLSLWAWYAPFRKAVEEMVGGPCQWVQWDWTEGEAVWSQSAVAAFGDDRLELTHGGFSPSAPQPPLSHTSAQALAPGAPPSSGDKGVLQASPQLRPQESAAAVASVLSSHIPGPALPQNPPDQKPVVRPRSLQNPQTPATPAAVMVSSESAVVTPQSPRHPPVEAPSASPHGAPPPPTAQVLKGDRRAYFQALGQQKDLDGFLNTLHAYMNCSFRSGMVCLVQGRMIAGFSGFGQFNQPKKLESLQMVAAQPSMFKIVLDSMQPYHGFLPQQNEVHAGFFSTFGIAQPEHVTLLPCLNHGEAILLLVGICSKEEASRIDVYQLLEEAQEVGKEFIQLSSRLAVA
jgi:hypothetical protein